MNVSLLAELGPCPSLPVDSSQKRTRSGDLVTLGESLVYSSITTLSGGVWPMSRRGRNEMNERKEVFNYK